MSFSLIFNSYFNGFFVSCNIPIWSKAQGHGRITVLKKKYILNGKYKYHSYYTETKMSVLMHQSYFTKYEKMIKETKYLLF